MSNISRNKRAIPVRVRSKTETLKESLSTKPSREDLPPGKVTSTENSNSANVKPANKQKPENLSWQQQLRGSNDILHKEPAAKVQAQTLHSKKRKETDKLPHKKITRDTENKPPPSSRVAHVRKTYSETRKELQDRLNSLENELAVSQEELIKSNRRNNELEDELISTKDRVGSIESSWDEMEKDNSRWKKKVDAYAEKMERLGLDPVTQEKMNINEDQVQCDVTDAATRAEELRQSLVQYKADSEATILLMQGLKGELMSSGSFDVTDACIVEDQT